MLIRDTHNNNIHAHNNNNNNNNNNTSETSLRICLKGVIYNTSQN